MTDDRVDFASMLASRLCHDLLSPVGAFANGLELLADEKDPAMRERCFELLEQSARTSANKLKFFRLAFGSAGGFGELVPADEAKSAIQGIIGDRAIELVSMASTASCRRFLLDVRLLDWLSATWRVTCSRGQRGHKR